MASLIKDYEYDIFISYRQKDNKHDGWVSEFVDNLKGELESTFKEDITVYFDINPHDGLLETNDVDASLKEKLRCLVFIPVISQTYCDEKSFAWEHEFRAFVTRAASDRFGLKVKLPNGNVSNRVLPVRIHEIDNEDVRLCESVLGGVFRGVDFIYRSSGVNRPLRMKEENPQDNLNHTLYRDQINKVANAIKEIITGMKQNVPSDTDIQVEAGKPVSRSGMSGKMKIIAGSLIIVSLLIAGYFIFTGLSRVEKSIAVLPFKNDSPEASVETVSFVNGLMEDLITNLQSIRDLRVLGRTSVEQYRDNKEKSAPEIARDLDVNYIIDGSVQKFKDRYVLRVRLSNAKKKESVLWGKSYKRDINETNDVLSVQTEIAQAIASELKAFISPVEKEMLEQVSTPSLDAYNSCQVGKEYFMKFRLNRSDRQSLALAESFFKKALKHDPQYAKAFTGLAMVFWEKHQDDFYAFSENYMDSVIYLSDKALSFDKNLAEAYSMKGDVFRVNGRYEEAIDEYNQALKFNPNYWQAYSGLGQLYLHQRRDFLNSAECFYKALKLNHDPVLRPGTLWMMAYYLDHMGFFPESEKYYAEFLKLNNDSAGYFLQIAWSKNRQEKYQEAIKLMKHSQMLNPKGNQYGNIGDFFLNSGEKDSAVFYYRKYLSRLDTIQIKAVNERHRIGFRYLLTGDPVKASYYLNLQKKYCEESIDFNREYGQNSTAYYDLAGIYALREDKKNAYRYLDLYNEKIGDSEFRSMVWFLKTDPFFESIRNEPEFQTICHDIEAKYNNTHERVRKLLEKLKMI